MARDEPGARTALSDQAEKQTKAKPAKNNKAPPLDLLPSTPLRRSPAISLRVTLALSGQRSGLCLGRL